MSDRHNGGNVPPDDLYRYSGGGNNGNDGGQGDLYRYSGTNNVFRRTDGRDNGNNVSNDNSGSDPFANDRMPGRQRPSDFPENIQQRYMTADGTLIINNVHCKNAFFNQTQIDGADYRRDPNMDFRQYDPNARNLRQRDNSSYYNNNDNGGFDPNAGRDVSNYNGGYSNYNRRPPSDYYPDPGRQAQIDDARMREQVAAQLREQMYRRSCEHVREANPNYSNQPYYDNQGYYPQPNVGHNRAGYYDNGGYPNRGYNRPDYSSNGYSNPNQGYNRSSYYDQDNTGYPNQGYNRGGVGVNIGVNNGGGSPCFGHNRTRISASVRLPGGIRIGGDF